MSNIVFCFSGTGNSLKAAKVISNEIGDCEIVSMAKPFNFTKQYDSIGFIYPTYFYGLPKKVIEFIKGINLENNREAYFYALATHGGDPGNAVKQLAALLNEKNVKLNYGEKLRLVGNYVIMYKIPGNINEILQNADKELIQIVNSVKARSNNCIGKQSLFARIVNNWFVKSVSGKDKNYIVNDSCSGCSICARVCPVRNIEIKNKKPEFKHNCEQCLACLQYCPQRAINYKKTTRKKTRYTHPEIGYRELAEFNNR